MKINKEQHQIVIRKVKERLHSIKREGMDKLNNFLENESDFYTAPASTKYHSNFENGLVIHSDYLVENMLEMNKKFNLGISEETIFLAGYMHDLCKVNVYKKGYGIEKHPETGKWVGVENYVFTEDEPLGHGEKSVIMLARYIHLTLEEELMIRWHMGTFQSHDDLRGFSSACDKCKGVALIHMADFMADHFQEVVNKDKVYVDVEVYNKWKKQREQEKR